jgi:hypothetical protein
MFVRFRQTRRSLQASLVETRRVDSKVQHEHIAGLGSIEMPPSSADRIDFWMKLYQRLDTLANRVDAEARLKILDAINARIPVPTSDDLRSVQAANTRQDTDLWETMRDVQTADVEERKAALTAMQQSIAERERAAEAATAIAKAARDRLERIERGEEMHGGISQRRDSMKDILKNFGWTLSDIRHARRLTEISDANGEWEKLISDISQRRRQVEKVATRATLRKRP